MDNPPACGIILKIHEVFLNFKIKCNRFLKEFTQIFYYKDLQNLDFVFYLSIVTISMPQEQKHRGVIAARGSKRIVAGIFNDYFVLTRASTHEKGRKIKGTTQRA